MYTWRQRQRQWQRQSQVRPVMGQMEQMHWEGCAGEPCWYVLIRALTRDSAKERRAKTCAAD